MLIVTVTLHPNGDASRARELGTARIANISDLAVMSDYEVRIIEHASPVTMMGNQQAALEIKEHRRDQSVWALVAEVAGRAARKFSPRPLPEKAPATAELGETQNRALDAWARGTPSREILTTVGITYDSLQKILARARTRGDARAVSRSSSGLVLR